MAQALPASVIIENDPQCGSAAFDEFYLQDGSCSHAGHFFLHSEVRPDCIRRPILQSDSLDCGTTSPRADAGDLVTGSRASRRVAMRHARVRALQIREPTWRTHSCVQCRDSSRHPLLTVTKSRGQPTSSTPALPSSTAAPATRAAVYR